MAILLINTNMQFNIKIKFLFKFKNYITYYDNILYNMTIYICNICNKQFTSLYYLNVHKREKHTFFNTIQVNCKGCLKKFNSVIFNKCLGKKYEKCKECRDLQKELSTNNIIHNSFSYGKNKQRFLIENGRAIRVCSVYTCKELFPCNKHNFSNIIECKNIKCNNCFIKK